MEFEWDPGKEFLNVRKHGISFDDASHLLRKGDALKAPSNRGGEPRWLAIGMDPVINKLITVVFTVRENRYRIISARRARLDEEEEYRRHVARKATKADSTREIDPREG